jgi:hypothetical protein
VSFIDIDSAEDMLFPMTYKFLAVIPATNSIMYNTYTDTQRQTQNEKRQNTKGSAGKQTTGASDLRRLSQRWRAQLDLEVLVRATNLILHS